MLKKTLLSISLMLASLSASATDFYVVVPAKGRAAANDAIQVALGSYSLPQGRVGTPYAGFDLKTLLSVTGDPQYTGYGVKWSVESGSLPAGLTLSSAGAITGTPRAGGTSSFAVKATYKTKSGQQGYQILVTSVSIGLAAGTLPEAIAGQAYSYDLKPLLSVTGDDAYTGSGVTWSVVESSLPAGLQLRTDGTISGTPTVAGDGSITARATYQGANGEQHYQVKVLSITVTLAARGLQHGMAGKAYPSFDFKSMLTVDGDPSYDANNVKFTADYVPDGMTLSPTGVLAGTPTRATNSSINVTANYKNLAGNATYSIRIGGVLTGVASVAVGASHACAILTGGGVFCWGDNSRGQLGTPSVPLSGADSPIAVPLGANISARAIYAGDNHTCVLTQSQTVVCWGDNSSGQSGNTYGSQTRVPAQVNLYNVTALDAGSQHTCAVSAGAAKCWGNNSRGQLGNNSTVNSSTPVAVAGLTSGVQFIGAGGAHSCANTSTGALMCWGENGKGQLGTNSAAQSSTPVAVNNTTGINSAGIRALALGSTHSCAATYSGVKCWGNNALGQLGNNTTTSSYIPVDVANVSYAMTLDAGGDVTCAGNVCWGSNNWGQLGRIYAAFSSIAIPAAFGGAAAVSVGPSSTCAAVNGGAKCLGDNSSGQLGNDSHNGTDSPVDVLAY